ncbi:Uncharacterised protein [Mycobacteroides abscessus subsp. abscessus]|nr:Uncharacterised protein [Mycobacteroides abscessus subsp. abscessus]
MKYFKVSQFWSISSLSQDFKTSFDKGSQTTTKNCLFTKQIFFSFFFVSCFQKTNACCTNPFTPVHSDVFSISCCILVDSVKRWNTKSFFVSTTYQVSWPFRSTHEDIYICRNFDEFEVDVKTMRKSNCIPSFQVWSNFCFVQFLLDFVWCQNHDNISQFSCFCYCISIKTIFFCLIKRFTWTNTDDYIVT